MIEIEGIHLQIKNQVLLENENIKIYEDCIHVITGESGSGKTTLLYEISLLSNISNAVYKWNELRIDKLSNNQRAEIRRNHIGYVLQDLELISEELSLQDNIDCMFALIGQNYDYEKVNEYMKQMNLKCSLSQKVDEMSRGERQRFALVLALIKDVELIICDEPTSALDKENTIELMNYLHIIARKYHKMIVIASHDNYVGERGDYLYSIENKHLVQKKQQDIIKVKDNVLIKKDRDIDNRFYKVYRKSNHMILKSIMKIIYAIIIVVLCMVPFALNSYLDKLEQLYDIYVTNEIIVVNTKESLPSISYNGVSQIFSEEQINMLKEIEHIQSVDDYWEMNGILKFSNGSEEVTILPKQNIKTAIFPTSLSKKVNKDVKIYATLKLESKEYKFEIPIDEYIIRDYPINKNILNEAIYLPYSQVEKLCSQNNITSSSAVLIKCDDLNNIESTISHIKRWLPNATVFSSGSQYKNQIRNMENSKQFINLLKIVVIVGIVCITYIIQMMENKNRNKEIANLRINGISKKDFYKLYYYETKYQFLLAVILCLIGYIGVIVILEEQFSVTDLLIVFTESIIYVFLTCIMPLLISMKQIFIKDIFVILREEG